MQVCALILNCIHTGVSAGDDVVAVPSLLKVWCFLFQFSLFLDTKSNSFPDCPGFLYVF